MAEDPTRVEQLRPFVRPSFLEHFDRDFYAEFGRYPSTSPLAGQRSNSARREKIATLALRGATEGERSAAQTALDRMDAAEAQHTAAMDRLDAETYDTGEGEL